MIRPIFKKIIGVIILATKMAHLTALVAIINCTHLEIYQV
jgi:hypothetical protein